MVIRVAGQTDVGRARARNEDALLQRPGRGVVAVADGMGGHAAGDIASRIAIDVVDDRTAHLPPDGLEAFLEDTVRAAHTAILRAAAADPALEGMGTTLTLLRIDPGTGDGRIAHTGDSRAYRWRDGVLERLTRDQTWVQDRIDEGALTPEQARGHPYSAMLTSALGVSRDLDIQIVDPEARPGDLFLLCSDGLTAVLTEDDLVRRLRQHTADDDAGEHDLPALARDLVNAANEAGGPDNITVGLVHVLHD
jgi:protein phosphatase